MCYDIRGPVMDEANRMAAEGVSVLRLNIGNPAPFHLYAPDEIVVDMIYNLRETEAAGATFAYVAYDHEPMEIEGARANNLSSEQLTANARAFCEAIAAAGYAPMLYGNQRDLLRLAPELRAAYPVWLAEYDAEVPTAPLDFSIWQYTNAGTVPGIPTDVDLNVWLEPQK